MLVLFESTTASCSLVKRAIVTADSDAAGQRSQCSSSSAGFSFPLDIVSKLDAACRVERFHQRSTVSA